MLSGCILGLNRFSMDYLTFFSQVEEFDGLVISYHLTLICVSGLDCYR